MAESSSSVVSQTYGRAARRIPHTRGRSPWHRAGRNRRPDRARPGSDSWPRRCARPARGTRADTCRRAGWRASGRPCRGNKARCRGRWCRCSRRRTCSCRAPVLGKMPGKDHVGPVADPQILRGDVSHAASGELVELFDQASRVEHDAAGDHAGDAGRENAAGKQRELVDLIADDDRVAGVGAALVADDEIMLAWSGGRRFCPWLRRPIADR